MAKQKNKLKLKGLKKRSTADLIRIRIGLQDVAAELAAAIEILDVAVDKLSAVKVPKSPKTKSGKKAKAATV